VVFATILHRLVFLSSTSVRASRRSMSSSTPEEDPQASSAEGQRTPATAKKAAASSVKTSRLRRPQVKKPVAEDE